MSAYIAFLRAINVGGRNVKMDVLRALFEDLGLDRVETFIASGNVIFDSNISRSDLIETIESALEESLQYEVATFLRTFVELSELVDSAPFEPNDDFGVYVSFLRGSPDKTCREKVLAMESATDSFEFVGDHLFWRCEGPSHKSKFSNAKLERALGEPATNRNIKTLRRLLEKTR